MKKGKISESVLKRSVLKYIHKRNDEMLKGAGIGEDCAFLKCNDSILAVSAQTMTLPVRDAGKLAVHAAVNNLAAGGAKAHSLTLALTLPEELPEQELQAIMKQTDDTCGELDIQIAGGHTEITDKVKVPVITVTAIGTPFERENGPDRQPGKETEKTSDGQPSRKSQPKETDKTNLDIVMTKWIGLEGTVILAKEKEQDLLTGYPHSIVSAAQNFEQYLSLLPEAATALKSGVYTMHDVRSGGVFGALYELAKRMGVGLSIDLKQIPVKQETIEICEFFDLNPYELLSGGSLLIVTQNGDELVEKLQKEGIFSAVIGKTIKGNDKVVLNEDETRYLEPAKTDEIFKINFVPA